MPINQVSLSPSAIARVLGIVALLLLIASIGMQLTVHLTGHQTIFGLVRLFELNEEQNIPTFFSTVLLLIAALLLAIITVLEKKRGASHVWHWAILALGFVYIAADEAIEIHEGWTLRRLVGDSDLAIFYFAWVIPAMAILLVLVVFFSRFLLHLPAKTRFEFLLSAALYVGGALGIEFIEGIYYSSHATTWAFTAVSTIQESLEMAGMIVFIWALLNYLATNHKQVCFRFEELNELPSTPTAEK